MYQDLATTGQLSAQLRSLRKAKGLSQDALGKLLGVGQFRIARIEKNPGRVSLDQLLGILHSLDARLSISVTESTNPAKVKNIKSKKTKSEW